MISLVGDVKLGVIILCICFLKGGRKVWKVCILSLCEMGRDSGCGTTYVQESGFTLVEQLVYTLK